MVFDIEKRERRFRDNKSFLKKAREQRKENPTLAEISFREKLIKCRIRFVEEKVFNSSHDKCNYLIDFYLPKPYKLCIEIDGGYHLTDYQIKKDLFRDSFLLQKGFGIWRLTNGEAEMISTELLKKKVSQFISMIELQRNNLFVGIDMIPKIEKEINVKDILVNQLQSIGLSKKIRIDHKLPNSNKIVDVYLKTPYRLGLNLKGSYNQSKGDYNIWNISLEELNTLSKSDLKKRIESYKVNKQQPKVRSVSISNSKYRKEMRSDKQIYRALLSRLKSININPHFNWPIQLSNQSTFVDIFINKHNMNIIMDFDQIKCKRLKKEGFVVWNLNKKDLSLSKQSIVEKLIELHNV